MREVRHSGLAARRGRGGASGALLACATLASATLASACATLVSGTTEEVTIRSVPSGARVVLDAGAVEGTTPVTLELRRKDAPYLVTLELDGYEAQRSYIRAEPNIWLWGNVLIGGVPGVLVDWGAGSLNDLEPNEIELELVQSAPRVAAPGGPP